MIHLDYERRFAMPRLNDKRPRSRCYYLRLATKERRGERRLFEWGKVVQPRVQLHPAATRTQLDIGGRIKAEQSLESIRCSRCSHALQRYGSIYMLLSFQTARPFAFFSRPPAPMMMLLAIRISHSHRANNETFRILYKFSHVR